MAPKHSKILILKVEEVFKQTEINYSRELKQFLPISTHLIIKDFEKIFASELKRKLS